VPRDDYEPNGFNQTIALTCAGNPRNSICVISPSSVTLDGVRGNGDREDYHCEYYPNWHIQSDL
jgi:hypothetical protein